jgi:uncharacterized membrane protein YcfT
MSHDDFAFEPIRGLPALLPKGEELLWQGAPDWKSLAIYAYHARKVALYFAALVLVRVGFGIHDGHAASAVALSCLWLVTLGLVATGVLTLLAYLCSRMTVYSITSQRLVLRHGIAVPMTINIPFSLVESAGLKQFANGTGDISINVTKEQRVGYLVTWPHVRPGHITNPQPSFRALQDAQQASEMLAGALAAQAGVAPVSVEPTAPRLEPRASAGGNIDPRTVAAF